jgi:predicted Ser/Thr protein kinase
MNQQTAQIFHPCQPDDFYGLRDTINDFVEQVNLRKKGEAERLSFIIVGDEGTGKSSLLKKLESSISGRKDITQIIELVPKEDELLDFFKIWKNYIDELSPEWRSLLEKVGKKRLGDDLPRLTDEVKNYR